MTKRHWGTFCGTELDLQLCGWGVAKIVLGGIATNFGIERTVRVAYELGYGQVFAEEAMTFFGEGTHLVLIRQIYLRIGRVRLTRKVLAACTVATG